MSEIIHLDGAAHEFFGTFESRRISPQMLMALEILASEEIPESAIKVRPGKGGKTFHYVSHTWVTQKLRDAFGIYWSMRVLDYQVFDDYSAMAVVELTIHAPMEDGKQMDVVIAEVGAFEDVTKKMPKAMVLASAVSRGLCRCVMRRFGIGKEFYEDDSQPTLAEAWQSIRKHADRQGLTEEEVLQIFDMNNITRANLLDEFMSAWEMITGAGRRKADREVTFESDDSDEETASDVRAQAVGARAEDSGGDNKE